MASGSGNGGEAWTSREVNAATLFGRGTPLQVPRPFHLMGPMRRRGSIVYPLLLAIATLVALVAFVYNSVQRLDQPPPRGYIESVRAKLLAEAGLRRAVKTLADLSLHDDVSSLDDSLDGTGTLSAAGDEEGSYATRVRDCAAMLWVNGPVDEEGKLAPWLVRVLDALGRARGVSDPLGRRLRAYRPAGGYASKAQLLAVLGADLGRVDDLLTAYAWVDPRTVRPASIRRARFASAPPPAPAARPWALGDPLNDSGALFGPAVEGPEQPRAHPPQIGEGPLLEPRAPVDVNTADRDLLVALFAGLRAETEALGKMTLSDVRASSLADDILQRRAERPFRSWADFASFLDGRAYLTFGEKSLVLANANPNTRLRRVDPSAARRRPIGEVGKDDLDDVGRSTELCFGSMGHYEIQSVGRVVRAGVVAASRCIHAVVRVHERYRFTTQQDFETLARSTRGVMSLPEHPVDFQGLSTASTGDAAPAMADGWLELAPRETRPERCSLAASFSSGPNAEVALGDPLARGTANHGVSVLDASDPSDILADGFLARDSYLRYAALRSFPPDGTLELWVKPDWDAAEAPPGAAGTRTFVCVGDARGWGPGQSPSPRMALFFRDGEVNLLYGDTAGEAWGRAEAYDEAIPAAAGEGHFGKVGLPVDWRAGEWHHLCVVWEAERAWLLVDGLSAPGGPLVARAAPFRGGLGDRASIFLGANRFGHHATNGWDLPAEAILDDLRVHASPRVTGREREGFPPPDRLAQEGGEVVLGLVPEGIAGPGGTLGTASWTWSGPDGAPPPEVVVQASGQAGVRLAGSGEPVAVPSLVVASASDVSVRVRLRPGPAPRRDSVVLDELTITLVTPTARYLSWYEE